jgi:ADP-ribose pyrophosphatase YjhB (NUDIX family)
MEDSQGKTRESSSEQLVKTSLTSFNEHLVRHSVRLVLLNERNELLMMKIELPDRSFWCTIGGGIEPGEVPEVAARREAKEEIGFDDVDLNFGPTIWQGRHVLERDGLTTYHQEKFILVSTRRRQLCNNYMTEEEKNVVKAFRWWSMADLKNTCEFIVPPSLIRHLEPVLAGRIPAHTLTIALGDDPDEEIPMISA